MNSDFWHGQQRVHQGKDRYPPSCWHEITVNSQGSSRRRYWHVPEWTCNNYLCSTNKWRRASSRQQTKAAESVKTIVATVRPLWLHFAVPILYTRFHFIVLIFFLSFTTAFMCFQVSVLLLFHYHALTVLLLCVHCAARQNLTLFLTHTIRTWWTPNAYYMYM